MRQRQFIVTTFIAALLSATGGCVEPFHQEFDHTETSVLVVEGTIQETTNLFLTRTRQLDETAAVTETGAEVYIENQDGSFKVYLDETNAGSYTAHVELQAADLYRVGIMTDGMQYYSEFVPVVNAPDIGQLEMGVNTDGEIEIYVSSKGPGESSRYYRWDFTETWEYHSAYESILKYDNGQILIRDTFTDMINKCYRTRESTNIIISSSSALSENVIERFPIVNIDLEHDARLDYRYSVLVRQYAITEDAFEFWQVMRKNTQELGTLFTPQPSQLRSNLYCESNPGLPVVGYISAGHVSEKRMLVDRDNVPVRFNDHRDRTCEIDTVDNDPRQLEIMFGNNVYLPLTSVGVYTPTGYLYSRASCVDCRLNGGTLEKPPFFE